MMRGPFAESSDQKLKNRHFLRCPNRLINVQDEIFAGPNKRPQKRNGGQRRKQEKNVAKKEF